MRTITTFRSQVPASIQPRSGGAASSAVDRLPVELRRVRIGDGTVASAANRAIRVRFVGNGPLYRSVLLYPRREQRHNCCCRRAPRRSLAPSEACCAERAGSSNSALETFSLVPDRDARRAISLLDWADYVRSPEQMLATDPSAPPEPPAEAARSRTVRAQALFRQVDGIFSDGGWAGLTYGSHLSLRPEASRLWLSTLGLYRLQSGDRSAERDDLVRSSQGKLAWHAAAHELEHAITPLNPRYLALAPEHTRVIDESLAEVLAAPAGPAAMRAAGARAPAMIDESGGRPAVDWAPFTSVPHARARQEVRRYETGPKLIRDLLHRAGIDLRTTSGRATARNLLQAADASEVPLRIARAITRHRGLSQDGSERIASAIRRAAIGESAIRDIDRLMAGVADM